MDAYRGFVMLLMMAEVVHLSRVAAAYPGNWFWGFLAYNQTHVEWAGCSLHDMIQPSFSFLVGVALPYSIASRIAKGGTFGSMLLHTLWRSFLLAWLGIFLRSMNSTQTNYTFEDTLTQIGLGYTFLFLLGFAFLAIGCDDAQARVAGRGATHFFSADLVASQFEALEPPLNEPGVLPLQATEPIEALSRAIHDWLAAKETA